MNSIATDVCAQNLTAIRCTRVCVQEMYSNRCNVILNTKSRSTAKLHFYSNKKKRRVIFASCILIIFPEIKRPYVTPTREHNFLCITPFGIDNALSSIYSILSGCRYIIVITEPLNELKLCQRFCSFYFPPTVYP